MEGIAMTITLPPRKILVPVDFSTQGFDAWKAASVMGLAFGAPLQRCCSILAPINFKRYSLDAIVGAGRLAEALSARLDALYVPDGPYSKALLDEAFAALVHCLPKAIQERRPLLFVRQGDPA